eukprot:2311364-Rhodomonas_salina.1
MNMQTQTWWGAWWLGCGGSCIGTLSNKRPSSVAASAVNPTCARSAKPGMVRNKSSGKSGVVGNKSSGKSGIIGKSIREIEENRGGTGLKV